MIKQIITIYFLFIGTLVFSQSYTISGYIVDKETGETIIGAAVVDKESGKGTSTNHYGFFQLSGLSGGDHTLMFRHVSYDPKEINVKIENKSIVLNDIVLTPDIISINEVSVIEVKPGEVGDKEIETSQIQITPKTIRSIPSARNDIFRAIKYLPGIEGTEPFSPLYSARGGDPGENRVLLDGVTIYNPYHYTTSAGIFNMQTIKNVDLLVGGFGAEFGGSNSSVLYITTKDGNLNELEGELEPSLTQTKAQVEFPINEKSSMMVGGRYFYDLPSRFMMYFKSYFYDFNLSYTNRINNRTRLTTKFFVSKDYNSYDMNKFLSYMSNSFDMDYYDDFHMRFKSDWNNFTGTAILKTIISPNVFLRTQVYSSFHSSDNISGLDFIFDVAEENNSGTMDTFSIGLKYDTEFKNRIMDIGAKSVLSMNIWGFNTIQAGVEYNNYSFENEAIINKFNKGKETRTPQLKAAFIEDKIKIGNLILRPGVRYSNYSYFNEYKLEPRVNLSYKFGDNFKVRAAWGEYFQYIISMNTQEYEVSQLLDYYYPLRDAKPSHSLHYILGFDQSLFNTTNLTVDFYYKDIQNIYTFNLNQTDFEIHNFSNNIVSGTGKAYGMEVMWKGAINKWSGWISYTLSRSTRSYPHIMDGKEFIYDYDRTHSLNSLINYQISPTLAYSSTLRVMSGNPSTVETTLQNYFLYSPDSKVISSYPLYVSNVKNNVRMPMILEWDVGAKKQLRKGFGADLAEFLKAEKSYVNVTIGNILFIYRNVLWYFPAGTKKYIPIGLNYVPYVNIGYTIKF